MKRRKNGTRRVTDSLKPRIFKPTNKNIGQITAIFFIQASSSAAFAVFFSGLSLYLTQQEYFTKEAATVITGVFLSVPNQLIKSLMPASIKVFLCQGGSCLISSF